MWPAICVVAALAHALQSMLECSCYKELMTAKSKQVTRCSAQHLSIQATNSMSSFYAIFWPPSMRCMRSAKLESKKSWSSGAGQ